MTVVPSLEVGSASYVHLGFSLKGFSVVDHVVLDTLSVEGALVLAASLTVACFRSCFFSATVEYFLVVGLEGRLDVFCTAVRKFYCVPIEYFAERVGFREVFVK